MSTLDIECFEFLAVREFASGDVEEGRYWLVKRALARDDELTGSELLAAALAFGVDLGGEAA